MKKVLTTITLCTCLFFSHASDVCVAVDSASISSFFEDSIFVSSLINYTVGDLHLSSDISYGGNMPEDFHFIELSSGLSVYPIEDLGLKVGLSLFKAGFFWGLGAQDLQPLFSSEAFIGWELKLSHFYMEPRLHFTESILEECEAERLLRETISQYSKVRFSLYLGIVI